MERFYTFVKALRRYSRKRGLGALKDNMRAAASHYHPDLNDAYVTEMAGFFLSAAETIFAYEATPFPDPLVEMRDPYLVNAALYARTDYTDEEIEQEVAACWATQPTNSIGKGPPHDQSEELRQDRQKL